MSPKTKKTSFFLCWGGPLFADVHKLKKRGRLRGLRTCPQAPTILHMWPIYWNLSPLPTIHEEMRLNVIKLIIFNNIDSRQLLMICSKLIYVVAGMGNFFAGVFQFISHRWWF